MDGSSNGVGVDTSAPGEDPCGHLSDVGFSDKDDDTSAPVTSDVDATGSDSTPPTPYTVDYAMQEQELLNSLQAAAVPDLEDPSRVSRSKSPTRLLRNSPFGEGRQQTQTASTEVLEENTAAEALFRAVEAGAPIV